MKGSAENAEQGFTFFQTSWDGVIFTEMVHFWIVNTLNRVVHSDGETRKREAGSEFQLRFVY